jgi:hypothetical protein
MSWKMFQNPLLGLEFIFRALPGEEEPVDLAEHGSHFLIREVVRNGHASGSGLFGPLDVTGGNVVEAVRASI